jgi:hypothetical protein
MRGVPNFREVPGVGVFGGAIATIDGVRSLLLRVGAAPDAPPVNGRQVGLCMGACAASLN